MDHFQKCCGMYTRAFGLIMWILSKSISLIIAGNWRDLRAIVFIAGILQRVTRDRGIAIQAIAASKIRAITELRASKVKVDLEAICRSKGEEDAANCLAMGSNAFLTCSVINPSVACSTSAVTSTIIV